MALDFNQRSFTKSVDQAAVDEGLRAYMLKVYNYMTTGLLLTGFIAYFFGKASIVTNGMGEIIGITQIGAILFGSPLKWVIMLAPLGFVFFLSAFITGGPIVKLGTKCPSITSTCIISAPPSSNLLISLPNWLKSADKIDGEICIFFIDN